ncbi:MAG: phage scaffolding protein [Ruminococcus sp.]|nr:phage scaffolding protein [Ruminococcus sp.]
MALSRKFLSALGIESDKVDEIIDAHTESINALKEQRDQYKADAEKLQTVQQELNELKENSDDGFEKKFNDLKTEFDQYKADVAAKEIRGQKERAYSQLLRDAGVSEKRITSVLKVSDIDKVEIDKDGAIKDADKLKETIKSEWKDFIETEWAQGAQTSKPPASPPVDYDSMSDADYYKATYEAKKKG